MTLDIEKLYLDELGDLETTGFTKGSILFVGDNAVTEDNANLFYDDTLNRVGIGTATPAADLEISKVDPEIRLTNTGDSEYTRITRSDTSKKAQRFNRVTKPGSIISGLVGHWKMNDTSGTTITDSSSEGNDLVSVRDTSLYTVAGKINSALDFNGSSDAGTNASPTNIPSGNSARTIAFWFNADSFDNAVSAMMVLSATGSDGQKFIIYPEDNAVAVGFQGHRLITPKSTLSTGTWYHVFIVVPSGATTTGEVLIYINNVNQSLSDEAGSSKTLNTANLVVDFSVFGAAFYDGRLDDVRIYDSELSSANRDLIYNSGSGTESNASAGTIEEVLVWSSEDGIDPAEEGIQTFGDSNGRTVIDGKTTRFNIAGSEIGNINASGFMMLGSSTEAATLFEIEDGLSETIMQISNTATDGDVGVGFALSGTRQFTIGVDDGTTNDDLVIDGGNFGTNRWLLIDGSTGELETFSGRKITEDRHTGNTTLTAVHHKVFGDTDGGAFTYTLPAGVAKTHYRLTNTGTSSNNLTITPDGSELLIGDNSSFVLFDGEELDIVYDATEGWG